MIQYYNDQNYLHRFAQISIFDYQLGSLRNSPRIAVIYH